MCVRTLIHERRGRERRTGGAVARLASLLRETKGERERHLLRSHPPFPRHLRLTSVPSSREPRDKRTATRLSVPETACLPRASCRAHQVLPLVFLSVLLLLHQLPWRFYSPSKTRYSLRSGKAIRGKREGSSSRKEEKKTITHESLPLSLAHCLGCSRRAGDPMPERRFVCSSNR